jgi:hypothetical protein
MTFPAVVSVAEQKPPSEEKETEVLTCRRLPDPSLPDGWLVNSH